MLLTVAVIVAFLVIGVLLEMATSGYRSAALGTVSPVDAEIAALGASGADCLQYLQSEIPHRSFRVVERSRGVGASFDGIRRRMLLGRGFRDATAASVLTAAHEFTHALQVGPRWTPLRILHYAGSVVLLGGVVLSLFAGGTYWWLGAVAVFLLIDGGAKVPEETDAIVGSLELSAQYLRHKGLSGAALEQFLAAAQKKTRATIIWYPLAIVTMSTWMGGSIALLAFLRPFFLASIVHW